MRRVLLIFALAVLVGAGVLFLLGRGRLGEVQRELRPAGAGPARLMTVRLYFGHPEHSGLVREDRVLLRGERLEDRLRDCIRELAAGPLTGGVPAVPERTTLKRAFLDPWGLAWLDFNRGLLGRRSPGDYEEWLAVASLVRTVCDNFPEIREIRIMVEGQVVVSLNGYIDLEEPLSSDDFPLMPVSGGF